MNAKKNLFNNLKDYANGVMKYQNYEDYRKFELEINCDSSKQAKTETLSFTDKSAALQEAYAVLGGTIVSLEEILDCSLNDDIPQTFFYASMKWLDEYCDSVYTFMIQNPKDFADSVENVNTEFGTNNPYSYKTRKEYFNSIEYEYLMCLLKKFAYVSAKKVYGYIENHDANSDEISTWKNECKKYMTSWDNNLTKPDKWYNTDDLSDTDVLLGSVKIFMTAKMISLLED